MATFPEINKMQAIDPRAEKFGGYLNFGHCGVKFITVLEDGKELRLHFRENQQIAINQIKHTYLQISDRKPEEKEKVEFLNTLSNRYVNRSIEGVLQRPWLHDPDIDLLWFDCQGQGERCSMRSRPKQNL